MGRPGGLRVAKRSTTRRGALQRLGAVAALACAPRVLAQAPPTEAITPALVEAARREGEVHLYTAMEIAVAERYAEVCEGKFLGIRVRVERSGAERIFSRVAQEYASRIYNVDLVNTTGVSLDGDQRSIRISRTAASSMVSSRCWEARPERSTNSLVCSQVCASSRQTKSP
jgi:hypothetical protein